MSIAHHQLGHCGQYAPPTEGGRMEGLPRSPPHPHPQPHQPQTTSLHCQDLVVAPLTRSRPCPRRTDHTYRDYSNFPLDDLPTGKKGGRNFPSKLHKILSAPENSHIISWMPHGRSWKIHSKDLLVRDVVPQYFVQSKYESFTRQLNGWGFKRLHQSGNDYNAYYHECFLRDIPQLTSLMKRVPPNQGKLLPHVEGEPNFYEIEKQYPLPSPMMMYNQHHYPRHPPFHHMPIPPAYGALPVHQPYHDPSQHPPANPSNYPPPSPHYGPHASYPRPSPAAYNLHPGLPPHPHYPAPQYGYLPSEQYPHPHYPSHPPYGNPPHYVNPPHNATKPVKSEQVSPSIVDEEKVPNEVEVNEELFEPLSIYEDSKNTSAEYSIQTDMASQH